MIPQEQQVTNLDLSRRLAAAGVPQDAYWSWTYVDVAKQYLLYHNTHEILKDEYGAFSPSELGEWLPPGTNYYKELNLGEELKWWSDGARCIEEADTLADAMGEMLLYLIEKGYVKVKELK